MSKKRKHGAPNKKRQNEHRETHQRKELQKLHRILDNATIADLDSLSETLTAEHTEEERTLIIHHLIARPGDDPDDPQEREVRINTLTKETQIFKRSRGSAKPWELEANPR